MKRNKTTPPPSAMSTVYLDVMEKGKFVCQLPYTYCPLFPVSISKLSAYIYRQRPSLRGRNIRVEFSNNRV